ncbi:MAG: acyl-ACP--UDP-N-acetylglucosamine O-acyltransferase [Candidatus Algichlamydia australiensis]|nr:acyl-ACP--UDP-N-acetylglucosamine O-acyltransferase [Chlamydiales bacterium]
MIDPTAIIEKGAELAEGVTIEPYAVIKKNVKLEKGVTIRAHAYIDGHTTIGENTVIYPSACIGLKTQARKFAGETTYVKIGKNCEIREFVTVNASFDEGSTVTIGDNCLIMAYCHIAHHCTLGNNITMANSAMLAGHVTIEDHAIIGGMTPVHQFSRIGAYAMVGGFSRVSHDVPPYTLGSGIPYRLGGLNIIGLKRNQFSVETRRALTKAFLLTYRRGLTLPEAIAQIEEEQPSDPHVLHWLDFCKTTKRGIIGLEGVTRMRPEDLENDKELLEV